MILYHLLRRRGKGNSTSVEVDNGSGSVQTMMATHKEPIPSYCHDGDEDDPTYDAASDGARMG